jgi:hypothetical protein
MTTQRRSGTRIPVHPPAVLEQRFVEQLGQARPTRPLLRSFLGSSAVADSIPTQRAYFWLVRPSGLYPGRPTTAGVADDRASAASEVLRRVRADLIPPRLAAVLEARYKEADQQHTLTGDSWAVEVLDDQTKASWSRSPL